MKKPAKLHQDYTLPLLASVTLLFMVILGQWGVVQSIEREKALAEFTRKEALPLLKEGAKIPNLSANAVYAIDVDSGKVLFARNEEEPVLPASTTKLATALAALGYYKPDEILTVGEFEVEGQTMELVSGEQISVRNLLYGLLLFSANDAAEVLAVSFPGGRGNFISQMNQLVKSLSLENTHFTNPAGFDEYLHFSTAKDLTYLALQSVQNPTVAEIVKTAEIEVSSVDGSIIHKLANLNQLVGKAPGVLGIKTGWTENAKEALITLVERNGHKIILSVLGSSDRFGETEKLVEWIFAYYSWGE